MTAQLAKERTHEDLIADGVRLLSLQRCPVCTAGELEIVTGVNERISCASGCTPTMVREAVYQCAMRMSGPKVRPARDALAEMVTRLARAERLDGATTRAAATGLDLRLTETGNAERFAATNRHGVRYVREWDRWYVANTAGRWAEDIGAIEVAQLVKKSGRALYEVAATVESDRAREEVVSWAKSSERRSVREATLGLARSEPGIPMTFRDLDRDPMLIGTPTGAVDLRTGSLRELRRDDLVSRCVTAPFDESARAPRWNTFLHEVLPDAETVRFFQRGVGYSLTGNVSEHCLFFLHGHGANGKSTALGVLLDLLGDYAAQAPASLLLARTGEQHPTELTQLFGRRFVACQEIDESRRFAEAQVKAITGGDVITARRMREDFWSFPPTHKLWIAANHKPGVRGGDEGIWRRIRLVPFEKVIPASDRDPRLGEALRAELPGILTWAVEGCLAWQREGLGASTAVLAATAAYRTDSDTVARWIADECQLEQDARPVTRSAVRTSYESWAEREGEAPLASRIFTERLRHLGLVEVSGVRDGQRRERGWRGIRLHVDTSRQRDAHCAQTQPHVGANGESVSTSVDVSTSEVIP
jgi:putative DNA primase/helicase